MFYINSNKILNHFYKQFEGKYHFCIKVLGGSFILPKNYSEKIKKNDV